MYGVSKITVEPGVMMISVQDAAFSAGSLARYLQIFADTGIVVDMISQSAPHGTRLDFSFTASSNDLPLVMKAISAAKLDPAPTTPCAKPTSCKIKGQFAQETPCHFILIHEI